MVSWWLTFEDLEWPDPNLEEKWKKRAALFAEKGADTAMMLTNAPKLDQSLSLVMLLRYKEEVASLSQKGLLGQIGPGRNYEDTGAFYQAVGGALQGGTHKKFELLSPAHVTTITSDQETFKRITAGF